MRTITEETRVLGVDDAPFVFEDAATRLIGTVFRGGTRIEGVLTRTVTVDGFDVTDRVTGMLAEREEVQAVLLDGITYAGFNIADLDRIAAADVAVVAVSRTEPDPARLEPGLRNVDRADDRRDMVAQAGDPTEHALDAGTVHFQHAGVSEDAARELLDLTTVRGLVPEPVRVAHMIGAALKDGGSKRGA